MSCMDINDYGQEKVFVQYRERQPKKTPGELQNDFTLVITGALPATQSWPPKV